MKNQKKKRIISADFSREKKNVLNRGGDRIFILLLAVWFMLNGRFDLDVWIAGLPLCFLIWFLVLRSAKLTVKKELRVFRLVPSLILYGLLLFWEIVKANIAVLGVIRRGEKPDSAVVIFHSGLKSARANALLANSITLTPGTITVMQEGDEFTVHCLKKEYGDNMENMSFVKALERMEKKWYK